jgi:hypothetical protein
MAGTTSVYEAAYAMRDIEIGDVIVIEHNQECDLITDCDIVCGSGVTARLNSALQ